MNAVKNLLYPKCDFPLDPRPQPPIVQHMTFRTSLNRIGDEFPVTVEATVTPFLGEPGSVAICSGVDVDIYSVKDENGQGVTTTDAEYEELCARAVDVSGIK